MKIACSKLDCFTDYNKCKDCQYKVASTPTYVSCYHALNADDLKFNVAVFKDDYTQQKDQNVEVFKDDYAQQKDQVVIETVGVFAFEGYEKVILTEL